MAGNEREFLERIKEEKWPIYKRTSNRMKIRKGDKILFYLAGSHRRKIVADAVLGTDLKEDGEEYSIGISKINLWKRQVNLKPFVESLEFIKNKSKWGVFMQGGIVRITEKDFLAITDQNLEKFQAE